MKKIIIMTLSVLTTTLSFAQTNSKDEQAVRSLFTTMETGWNNKSGETFASVFADVHDYIVVNGVYLSNFTQKANATVHQGLLSGVYKNADIKLNIDKITFLRPDLALATALGARYEKGTTPPEDPTIIMTVLAEKKNNVWKIISFHNHEINMADIKARSAMPLNVMFASWYKK